MHPSLSEIEGLIEKYAENTTNDLLNQISIAILLYVSEEGFFEYKTIDHRIGFDIVLCINSIAESLGIGVELAIGSCGMSVIRRKDLDKVHT